MSKGQQRKIRGAFCNVPVHFDAVSNILPRPPFSCGFIMVKLKRKIEFKGHCYFQAVRPTQDLSALTKLKEINSLYQSIDIDGSINDICHIQDQWFKSESTGKNSEHQESVVDDPPSENNKEEQEDPLSNYRSAIDE